MQQQDGIDDVFRAEWFGLVATLVRDIGDLGLAEDSAQDAFIEAAVNWPTTGSPDRPGAWLLTTARRKAIDRVRRDARFAERLPHLLKPVIVNDPGTNTVPTGPLDEQLALLVGCCHPALAPESQVALTLRAVAGLSTAQIARAFFVSESTMTRRLTRARTKIREARIPFVLPDLDVLSARLPAVCSVISSIFTEGHTSTDASTLIRGDLCDEATWLADILTRLVPDDAEAAGLYALFLLTDARRATRVDDDGIPVLLADQDRSRWDQSTIARGLAEIARAHALRRAGPFQLQAAIAALHATAPSFDKTDWRSVLRLYDVMLSWQPTAVLALNRAIAVRHVDGPAAALRAVEAISEADDLRGDLTEYPYFHATCGELFAELNRSVDSAAAFDRAIAVCSNTAERAHLERRRRAVAG
jgi:RNA polymerase sigma-70 factor (ECF subfamily)